MLFRLAAAAFIAIVAMAGCTASESAEEPFVDNVPGNVFAERPGLDIRLPEEAFELEPPLPVLVEDESGFHLSWQGVAHPSGDRSFVVVEYCGETRVELTPIIMDATEYTFDSVMAGCVYAVIQRDVTIGDSPESIVVAAT